MCVLLVCGRLSVSVCNVSVWKAVCECNLCNVSVCKAVCVVLVCCV